MSIIYCRENDKFLFGSLSDLFETIGLRQDGRLNARQTALIQTFEIASLLTVDDQEPE